MTVDCINYNISIFDFILPPYQIFFKICLSFDKTKMFLVSMIRLFVWLVIFKILRSKQIVEWDPNNNFKVFTYLTMILIIFINVIYILFLLIKTSAINKYDLGDIAGETALYLKKNQLGRAVPKSNLEQESNSKLTQEETSQEEAVAYPTGEQSVFYPGTAEMEILEANYS
jgi:hypothetical protein